MWVGGGCRGALKVSSALNDEDFININVCGMMYETLRSTLEKFPTTLLGTPERRKNYFVKCKNAYFFDRNRQSFEAILYYYQSGGILIRPPNIPMPLFHEEITFFDLGENAISNLQENEGFMPETKEYPKLEWQRKLWELFEFPDSSFGARILATWSIMVITISITVFCMETMPEFGLEERRKELKEIMMDIQLLILVSINLILTTSLKM